MTDIDNGIYIKPITKKKLAKLKKRATLIKYCIKCKYPHNELTRQCAACKAERRATMQTYLAKPGKREHNKKTVKAWKNANPGRMKLYQEHAKVQWWLKKNLTADEDKLFERLVRLIFI